MASSTTKSDREHQSEQRQRVDRKPEKRKNHERADERNRNRQQRNQRRAPALQEKKYDDDDEDQGFTESLDDFLHSLGDGKRGIERDLRNPGPEGNVLCFGHQFLRAVGRGDGVGTGKLIEGEMAEGLPL